LVGLRVQSYPGQIAGIVLVDPLQPDSAGAARRQMADLPGSTAQSTGGPGPARRAAQSRLGTVDLDASAAQVLAAPALPAMPHVVLAVGNPALCGILG
jgi:hypothetical protein